MKCHDALFMIVVLTLSLASCVQLPPELRRIFDRMRTDFDQNNVVLGDPVFIRIFKEERVLELWMKNEDDWRFKLIKSYPICNYSGSLGPKYVEGDNQAPEGFYHTDLQSLNPNSQYHLSFNINFPNEYDRSKGRTGSFIMIHGDCVSEGCYAMTDPLMEEIYLIAERALLAGQHEVPVHVFPFRMTPDRMRQAAFNRHFHFWVNLKQGYDYFENYGIPPKWDVINGRYEFY